MNCVISNKEKLVSKSRKLSKNVRREEKNTHLSYEQVVRQNFFVRSMTLMKTLITVMLI